MKVSEFERPLFKVGRFPSLSLLCVFVGSGYWVPCGELGVEVPPLLSARLVLPVGCGEMEGRLEEQRDPPELHCLYPENSILQLECPHAKQADSDV